MTKTKQKKNKETKMIGYKAFDKDLRCRGFQFKVGKTYSTGRKKDELKVCSDTVFHFCRELHRIECESDYRLSESRVCEVIATGDIVSEGSKFGTNEIKILRELTKEEKDRFCERNTGNWNTGDRNTGFFNTEDGKIMLFNKPTDKKRQDLNFPNFLYFDLTVWVSHDTATDEEKEEHKKEIECAGGFLKKLDYKDAFRRAYDKASAEEHGMLFALPNFDPAVFEEISGIDTADEYAKWKQEEEA